MKKYIPPHRRIQNKEKQTGFYTPGKVYSHNFVPVRSRDGYELHKSMIKFIAPENNEENPEALFKNIISWLKKLNNNFDGYISSNRFNLLHDIINLPYRMIKPEFHYIAHEKVLKLLNLVLEKVSVNNICRMLLEVSKDGDTPFSHLIQKSNLDCYQLVRNYLIEKIESNDIESNVLNSLYNKINHKRYTLLVQAMQNNNLSKQFFEDTISFHKKNYLTDETIQKLVVTFSKNNLSIFSFSFIQKGFYTKDCIELINYCLNSNIISTEQHLEIIFNISTQGYTPLHQLCNNSDHDGLDAYLEVIASIITNQNKSHVKSQLTQLTSKSYNVLHHAAMTQDIHFIKKLLNFINENVEEDESKDIISKLLHTKNDIGLLPSSKYVEDINVFLNELRTDYPPNKQNTNASNIIQHSNFYQTSSACFLGPVELIPDQQPSSPIKKN